VGGQVQITFDGAPSLIAHVQSGKLRVLAPASAERNVLAPDAPPARDRQHYELQGSRAYISGSWKIVSLQTPDKSIDLDNWMLFNLVDDPAEINDLAPVDPARLRQMIDEFETEAGENHEYSATGARKGQASAWLHDKPCATEVDLSPTMLRIPTAGMSVGLSRRLSVSERYAHHGAFQYAGVIDHVLIRPGELAPESILEPSEEVAQARIRAAARSAG